MGDMLSNYALSNFFPHPYLKEIYNIGHLKLKKKETHHILELHT